MIQEIRESGARIKLIEDGDVGTTHSVVMRAKSGTVRFIDGKHSLKKKPDLVIKP